MRGYSPEGQCLTQLLSPTAERATSTGRKWHIGRQEHSLSASPFYKSLGNLFKFL